MVALIEARGGLDDPDVARARSRAAGVILNHHNLLLALPGSGAARTAGDRAALARLERGDPLNNNHGNHRGTG